MRAFTIYATNFLLASAIGVVFVFFEDVQTKFGLFDVEVGLIAGAGFGASFFVQLTVAPLADRGGTGPLSIVALVAGIVGLLGFAFGTNVLVLAVGRSLSGVALGLFMMLARKALIGLDAQGGGPKLGILLSTVVAGFITGPLIGAAFEPLGFEAPFVIVAAALAVVGFPATLAVRGSEIAIARVDYRDLGTLIRRPKVQAAMIVQVIVFGYIGVFNASIDRFLTDLGASTQLVAGVVIFVGAPLVVLPRIAGALAESRGGSAVMLPALLILLPAMFGYGFVSTVGLAMFFGVLHGSGESFASVSAQVLVLEVTGAERAAVGSALLDAAGLLAATLAAFSAPIAYGAVGQDLFIYTGVIGAILAAAALLRVRSAWD